MSKIKKQYVCTNCGSVAPKWSGQCFDCHSWSTIIEEIISQNSSSSITASGSVQKLEQINSDVTDKMRTKTSINELDVVLGGGLVAAAAILIGGDPGIGKSTLLLQLATSLSSDKINCLYITGEESADQVKLRAKRLGITTSKANILACSNIEDILSTIETNKKSIELIIIDSIQTMYTNQISSAPGTVSQIKATAHELVTYTKKNNITLFLACHVTKEGELAGPKVLEHMVDTVLYFEGDRRGHFRLLRSIKNRFGPVGEVGVFEMTAKGLMEIANPSELFLMERENNVSGTAIFAGMEGTRPLLIEIQALVASSNMPTPRRSVVGWDLNRLSMIIAVLNVRFGLNLTAYEIYLSVAGGLKITEPAADLAVAAALISAASNKALPKQSVFFGEIGLSGEVRKVAQPEARIKESTKLGFDNIICAGVKDSKLVKSIFHLKQLKDLI